MTKYIYLIVIYQLFDIITTLFGTMTNIIQEMNPMINAMLQFNPILFVGFKCLVMMYICYSYIYAKDRNHWSFKFILIFIVFVPFWNIFNIYMRLIL